MSPENHLPVGSDERIMAGLSHLFGLLPAAVFWAVYKDQSTYVRFQALQAMLYYGFVIGLAVILMLMVFFIMALFMGLMVVCIVLGASGSQPEIANILLVGMILFMGVFSLSISMFAFVIFGLDILALIASISSFLGKDWHYPLIGDWVEKLIKRDQE